MIIPVVLFLVNKHRNIIEAGLVQVVRSFVPGGRGATRNTSPKYPGKWMLVVVKVFVHRVNNLASLRGNGSLVCRAGNADRQPVTNNEESFSFHLTILQKATPQAIEQH